MKFISYKTAKTISMILIIAILMPSFLFLKPTKAEAIPVAEIPGAIIHFINRIFTEQTAVQTTIDTGISIKNVAKEVARQVLMAMARKALQEITKNTINWINTGFNGNPLYIENSDSFFKDIAKYEVRTIVDTYGYDKLKYPFGKDFAINTITAYKNTVQDNAAYSLSKVMSDPVLLKNYQTNFNAGGWDGFLINTQFPQNNYIGFRMKATEELARKIEGTVETAKEKTEKTLAQGQGFLSPMACPESINPTYNDGFNEFKRPSFNMAEWEKKNPYELEKNAPACKDDANSELCWQQAAAYDAIYEGKRNGAKTGFELENSCTKPDGSSGLVATTPGSVVANQIMNSMSSQVRQSELGAALGNSLSAVFDALLNKFIGDGLNSLTTKSNPKPPAEDNWSYNGLTLGSPSSDGGTNTTWDAGPDEEIVLSEFKKLVDEGIANTKSEIQALSDTLDTLGKTWPEIRLLDICVPGPDLGWEYRTDTEMNKSTVKIQGDEITDETNSALQELQYAVNVFKDWVNNKMMTELPNALIYIDTVNGVKDLSQQGTEIISARRDKTQALSRLESIKTSLGNFTSQPASGSNEEKNLISLKRQFNTLSLNIGNSTTLDEAQNALNIAKDTLTSVKNMTKECEVARDTKGWGVPGGSNSSYVGTSSAETPIIDGIDANSEQAIFCNLPISGGFTHGTFIGPDAVRPQLPMVNAKNVVGSVAVNLSCNTIYKANILDYKGSLPGITTVTEVP